MTETISEQKKQLRKICRKTRQELGEIFRQHASLKICHHIADLDIFSQAKIILTYFPINTEVDLKPLMADFPAKQWVLPRINPDSAENSLCFHFYDPQHLVRHPFGMDEPAASLPTVPAENIELALVPGLAYDLQGMRLGYGGGYYDRFLAKFPGNSLGICFAALLLDHLPVGEFDIPMHWLLTENGLLAPHI